MAAILSSSVETFELAEPADDAAIARAVRSFSEALDRSCSCTDAQPVTDTHRLGADASTVSGPRVALRDGGAALLDQLRRPESRRSRLRELRT